MLYDSTNKVDVSRARKRFEQLLSSGKIFELAEKNVRSLSQNNYLHLIINYLALELGEAAEYVKEYYYKLKSNRDIFLVSHSDAKFGNVNYIKSSSNLSKEEMTLTIERFRNFSSSELGVYLPEPNEEDYIRQIQLEVRRNNKFI